MRVWRNLAAGFGGSVLTAVVGLLVVPYYLRALGIEAYGLIGFFAAMQAIVQVLDFGLSPTMNREVARCQARGEQGEPRDLMRTLSIVSFAMAALIASTTILTAPWIGAHWLKPGTLPTITIERSIMLMGVIIGLRWPASLYLGVLQGAHRIQTAAGLTTLAAVVGNVGAVAVLLIVSPTVEAYFLWQTGVALTQLVIVRSAAWAALGGVNGAVVKWKGLRHVWRFSAGIAVTSILGILFMQLDKLILSRIVSLEELGRYTLAGLAARSLYLVLSPVFNVIYPRLTALVETNNTSGVIDLYRTGTRLLLSVLFPLALFVGVFACDIYTLWFGDAGLAKHVATAAGLLIIGTAMNGAMHFPFALQLAYGRSRLPATINTILIFVFAPMVFVLARAYGIVGGAAAWAILNTLYLFLGTWLTHRVILPGLGKAWLFEDVGIPLGVSVLVVGIGGWATQALATPIFIAFVVGIALTGVSVVLSVALSPHLLTHARSLITRPFTPTESLPESP